MSAPLAIITRYTPAGRLVARANGDSAWSSRATGAAYEEDHAAVAQRLAEKLGWHGTYYGGLMPTGGMVWVRNTPDTAVPSFFVGAP